MTKNPTLYQNQNLKIDVSSLCFFLLLDAFFTIYKKVICCLVPDVNQQNGATWVTEIGANWLNGFLISKIPTGKLVNEIEKFNLDRNDLFISFQSYNNTQCLGYNSNFAFYDASNWVPSSARGGQCYCENLRGGQ